MDFKETSLEIAIEAFISVLDLAPYTAKIKEGLHEDPRFKNFDDSAVRLETAKFEGLTWIADLFIERIFPTRVCVKGDERYEALSQKNWSQTCWMSPRCIFSPASTEEVALALRIIVYFSTPFAVRSGGHMPNPGFGNIGEEGILIELSAMNQITISEDKTVVSIGPGNRWSEVYGALDAHGTTVVGARIPQVGVSGLILGGGISFFMNEYGFACDGVKNFEVVLADSRIVNANPDENPDLFWALKGGGANFGIVTRFDLYTRPSLEKIWYEVRAYKASENDAVLEAIEKYQKEGELDPKASFTLTSSAKGTLVCYAYGAPVERPAAFDAFMDIPYMHSPVLPASTIGTHLGLAKALTIALPDTPGRRDYRILSSGVSAELYKEGYAFWKQAAAEIFAATGALMNFSIQPVSKNATMVGKKYGGNAMGVSECSQAWFMSMIDWQNEADDEAVRAALTRVADNWVEVANRLGLGNPFVIMNCASRDQNPLKGYGEENVARLKEISQKYDQGQVFQKLQNSGFLLSKS